MSLQPINIATPAFITDPPRGLTAKKFSGMSLAFKNLDDGSAEILVYGSVGEAGGTTPTSVARMLRDNPSKDITVRINSPGGYAYDGIAVYNQLLAHKGKVTALIEGIAGSAASIIAMAARPIRIYANASVFIHRSSGTVVGNAEAMREATAWLDQLDSQIAATYAARTGRPKAEMMRMMVGKFDGTQMKAEEAKSLGFADVILPMATGRKELQPAKTASRLSPIFKSVDRLIFKRQRRNALCGIKAK